MKTNKILKLRDMGRISTPPILYLLLSLIFFLVTINGVIASVNLNDGLVSYWSADNTSGWTSSTLIDVHGVNNGSSSNERVFGSAGKIGQGLDFSKGNDIITVNHDKSLVVVGAFSINFWYKGSKAGSYLFRKGSNLNTSFYIYDYGGGRLYFYSVTGENARVVEGFTFPTNEWAMVTMVYNGSNLKIYKNGEYINQTNATGTVATTTNNLFIGAETISNGFIGGYIDEFSIYNISLNSTSITMLYNSGEGLQYPFVIGLNTTYTFNTKDLYDDSTLAEVSIRACELGDGVGCCCPVDICLDPPSPSECSTEVWSTKLYSGSKETSAFGTLTLSWEDDKGEIVYVASKTGYETIRGTINSNSTETLNLYSAKITLTDIYTILNETLENKTYSINTTGKTYTRTTEDLDLYLRQGDNSLIWYKSGWYPLTENLYVDSVPNTTTATISGIYDSIINISAKEHGGGAVNNYSILAKQGENVIFNSSTTNGSIRIEAIQGKNYTFIIDAENYALLPETEIFLNSSLYNLSFSLYAMNSFNITIYDEKTNLPIESELINLELISDEYSQNYTFNKTIEITLLVPTNYEIRYKGSDLYNYTRSYYTTLTARSYTNLRLYQINTEDGTTYFIPSILNEYGGACEGNTIHLLRGYIEGDSMVSRIVEMSKSNPSGTSVLRIYPNDVYYKFYGEGECGTFTTAFFKITTGTLSFPAKKTTGVLTSRNLIDGGVYNLSYNEGTKTFILTWLDNTNTITRGCLQIKKDYATISDTCGEGSTGSVIYTITDTNQTSYTARASIKTSTEYSTYYDFISVSFKDAFITWGTLGLLFTFLLTLFLVFMSGNSVSGVVISASLGILLMSLIGIIAFQWTAIVGILALASIIIYKTST